MTMLALLLALASAQAPQAAAAEKDADPVVCTRQVVGAEVGTHMRSKKVCMKKSEWDYVERHTRDTLQLLNGRGNNPGPAEGRAGSPE
jgi:hypothetical protein